MPSPSACFDVLNNVIPAHWVDFWGKDAEKMFDSLAVNNYQSSMFNHLAIVHLRKKQEDLDKLRIEMARTKDEMKELEVKVLKAPEYEAHLKAAKDELERLVGQQQLDAAALQSAKSDVVTLKLKTNTLVSENEKQQLKIGALEKELGAMKQD